MRLFSNLSAVLLLSLAFVDLQLVEERRLSDAERADLEARLPAFTEAALSR